MLLQAISPCVPGMYSPMNTCVQVCQALPVSCSWAAVVSGAMCLLPYLSAGPGPAVQSPLAAVGRAAPQIHFEGADGPCHSPIPAPPPHCPAGSTGTSGSLYMAVHQSIPWVGWDHTRWAHLGSARASGLISGPKVWVPVAGASSSSECQQGVGAGQACGSPGGEGLRLRQDKVPSTFTAGHTGLIKQMSMARMGEISLGDGELSSRAQPLGTEGLCPSSTSQDQAFLLREETLTQQWGWPALLLHPVGCPRSSPFTCLLPWHPAPHAVAGGTPRRVSWKTWNEESPSIPPVGMQQGLAGLQGDF